ncbi:hypothetical protein [Streptomyces europaeiscabiei]|uniref:hypothetical protein n=1 Tax=Streptomyces europaeiscabiei TaxID=146819 RepID=UPI0029B68273|nr:hypothetical protein [Streptomyces europaeiscabiei]MDX3838962.1 hypothetical protein [Streptomyces europaeiscabiei]
MDKAIDFFKDNPELFTGTVALLAIFGGILGNWLSAWWQARGGIEQANAARDAARITAEAERLAALREDRRVEIAAFVRLARETFNATDDVFRRADLDQAVLSAHGQMEQKYAEIELIAPPAIVSHADDVVSAVERAIELATARGAASRAHWALTAVSPGSAGYLAAHRASTVLEALREAYEAGEENAGEQDAFRSAARSALEDVPGINGDQAEALLLDSMLPALEPLRAVAINTYAQALRELIASARSVLGSDDT